MAWMTSAGQDALTDKSLLYVLAATSIGASEHPGQPVLQVHSAK